MLNPCGLTFRKRSCRIDIVSGHFVPCQSQIAPHSSQIELRSLRSMVTLLQVRLLRRKVQV